MPSRKASKASKKSKSSKSSKSCRRGRILRKGYVSGKGTRVSASCIRATSQSGRKTTSSFRASQRSASSMHQAARKKFGVPKCSKGQVIREGFKRTSGTWVSPTCITTGNAVKGKKLFDLEKGDLTRYGYKDVKHLTVAERHAALKEAVAHGAKTLPLSRKLNALYVLNEHKHPELAKRFKDDSDWVKSTF